MDMLPVGVVVAAGFLVAVFGLRAWHRYLAVADTPTSRCGAVFVGRNEVAGWAQPAGPGLLTAPVTGAPCTWFRLRVEVEGNNGHRRVVEEQTSEVPFWLVDDSGQVLVHPYRAEVDAPLALEQRNEGRHWVSEWRINPNEQIYVLGTAAFQEEAGVLELAARHGPLLITTDDEATVSRRSRARGLAALVLGFAAALAAPLMAGILSATSALEDARDAEFFFGDHHRTSNGPFFALWIGVGLLKLVRDLRSPSSSLPSISVYFAWLLGVPLGFLHFRHTGVESTVDNLPTDGSPDIWAIARPWMLEAGGAYLLTALVLYLVGLHNRLVRLKQQAAAAWSLIDVALRRRHDLLPNLVGVVRRYADHERALQQRIAELRGAAQLPPSETLPSDTTLAATLRVDHDEASDTHALLALGEAHPALAADEIFRDLAHRMTDTENRIAYARHFYNDAVTVLRTRRRTFPGLLVAPLVATPSWNLFGSDLQPGSQMPAGQGVVRRG